MGRKRHPDSVDAPCAVCGRVSFHPGNKVLRGERLYCSRHCAAVGRWGQRGERKSACDGCGTPIDRYVPPSRKLAFCTHACYGRWRSANLAGENAPQYKGGDVLHYGGTHWKRQRRLARERDQHRCRDCGTAEQPHGYQLDVHHVEPFPRDGTSQEKHRANRLENLVTLCRPCHAARERAA